MHLFDTNIFLEIFLNQALAEACKKALAFSTPESPGWITSFSCHALEVILERAAKKEALEKFLSALMTDRSLMRYETSLEEELEIIRLTRETRLDFDDTLQFYVARKKDLTLVTLDSDFKKVKGIRILSPREYF